MSDLLDFCEECETPTARKDLSAMGLRCVSCDPTGILEEGHASPSLKAATKPFMASLNEPHLNLSAMIVTIMQPLKPIECDCGEADFGDGQHYITCPKRLQSGKILPF